VPLLSRSKEDAPRIGDGQEDGPRGQNQEHRADCGPPSRTGDLALDARPHAPNGAGHVRLSTREP
jgi:hypothetical protein